MIWKITTLLSLALCVLGDGHHAISEQRINMNPQKYHGHHGDLDVSFKSPEHHEEYAWSYPSYEFSYEVHDPHTHDMKGQQESRHGDEVKGEYWLIQPDGRKRTVHYHADQHHGFKAIVKYSKHDGHNDDIQKAHDHEEIPSNEESPNNEASEGDNKNHDKKSEHATEENSAGEQTDREGEESRNQEGYRQAWVSVRDGRRRDYDEILGRRESVRAEGHGRDENHGRDVRVRENYRENDRHRHHEHETYNYPRFYRQSQVLNSKLHQ